MQYPPDMDTECVSICDALNAMSGIETTSSCCGHDRRPFCVFFVAQSVSSLSPLLRALDGEQWRVEVAWAHGSDTLYYMLEGPRRASAGDALAAQLRA